MKTKFTWDLLQAENQAWTLKNFGQQPPHQPMLGIFEELGELNFADQRHDDAGVKDGIADVMVFAASLCWNLGFRLENICDVARTRAESTHRLYRHAEQEPAVTLRAVGSMSHSLLKLEQNIRGSRENHLSGIQNELTLIVEGLYLYCLKRNWEMLAVVQPVWEKVRERDWTKDRLQGGAS
jgi:NTP pyrophosphatase (non-canonical NTP hydrolase)